MNPPIVIAAYDRPEVLSRLLRSLENGIYPVDVRLIISVDPGGRRESEVLKIAGEFQWRHGRKDIMKHDRHLGIVPHFFLIGSLSTEYGSVIRLEDDYFVSPMFYLYTSKALDFYRDDPRIAAVSFYNVWFNGITKEPFIPFLDEGDVYFVQSPWAHGLAFHAEQWEQYVRWHQQHDHLPSPRYPIHQKWDSLDEADWFPSAARYLVETNRFYVFPRESLCTNFGDAGQHFRKSSRYFHAPLQMRRSDYRFQPLDDCRAVYDSFQEMVPERMLRLTGDLEMYDVEMDLNGTKSPSTVRRPYVVTSQHCISPIRTWGLELYPRELNIVEGIPGGELKLCRREDLRQGAVAGLIARFHQYEYARSRYAVSLPTHILFWLTRKMEALMKRLVRRARAGL